MIEHNSGPLVTAANQVIKEAEIFFNNNPSSIAPQLYEALVAYKALCAPLVREEKPPFIIYTTSAFLCPYCVRAKKALDEHGYRYDERDINDPAVKTELLERRPGARTVPQIFLANGYYIGGCDDLLRVMASAHLGLLLEANT